MIFNQLRGVQGSADWEQGSAPCWGVEDAGCRSGHSQSHSKLLVPISQKYICHRLLRHKQRYLKNLVRCNGRKFCHFMWDESVLNLLGNNLLNLWWFVWHGVRKRALLATRSEKWRHREETEDNFSKLFWEKFYSDMWSIFKPLFWYSIKISKLVCIFFIKIFVSHSLIIHTIYEWQGPSVPFPFMTLHPDWQVKLVSC